jgi:hypothetical protein
LISIFVRFFEDVYKKDIEQYGHPAGSEEIADPVEAWSHNQVIIKNLATKVKMEKVLNADTELPVPAEPQFDRGESDAEASGKS